MTGRYVVDKSSGTALVFPDLLRINIQSENQDTGVVIFGIDAELTADPKLISQLKNARQIVMGDEFFVMRRPVCKSIEQFEFVPTGGLRGRIVLVVKAGDAAAVKKRIISEIGFFDPEYSGRSESYESLVELATVKLSDLDVEAVRNQFCLVKQIEKIMEIIRTNSLDFLTQYVVSLAQKLIDDDGNIQRREGFWYMAFAPGEKSVRLTELQEVITRVSGDKADLQLG